jgi:predicted dehydrogenase
VTSTPQISCPDQIAIIGGGRWARILIEELVEVVPPATAVSVYSPRNADAMSAWTVERNLHNRITVSPTMPPSLDARTTAVIVVNATRNHEAAAAWSLAAGAATLIEKPVALSFSGAQRLADIAREHNASLAVALTFLFAGSIERFSKQVVSAGSVESLHIEWMDPADEDRHGERKRFDAGIPVFVDVLPHVCSIIDATLGRPVDGCRSVEVGRGGAAVDLELAAGDVRCSAHLERNGNQRTRSIRAIAGGRSLQLDFSSEPGVIRDGGSGLLDDSQGDSTSRPLGSLLTAFLAWAAGGKQDDRLDFRRALTSSRIVDQTSALYASAIMPWLIERLNDSVVVDGDVRYALSELLQADGALPQSDVDRSINAVASSLSTGSAPKIENDTSSGAKLATWLRELAATG